jgi:hypothetical protein
MLPAFILHRRHTLTVHPGHPACSLAPLSLADTLHSSSPQLYLLGSYWIIKEKDIADAVGCGRACDEIDRETASRHFQARDFAAAGFPYR